MTLVSRVPGSKSMTQRALIIAALADGPMTLRNALRCDDSARLTELLQDLGVEVTWCDETVRVVPPAVLRPSGRPVFCGNAGTTVRFGSCLSLLTDGEIAIDGDSRMRERPIGPLGAALADLGCSVRYLARDGFPPLAVRRGLHTPKTVRVDASMSSQFASGLTLVAPRLPEGLELQLSRDAVSLSYLRMTTKMMASAGVRVEWRGENSLVISPGIYRGGTAAPVEIAIEPDWSGAAFVLAAGRVANIAVAVPGLCAPQDSLQGDSVFARFLAELDAPRVHDIDLSDCPDLIAPLVAAALFASHPTRIRGAAHTRIKESDRIAVLCGELRKVGAEFIEYPDGMDVQPLTTVRRGDQLLCPAADHRMAMAFGVVSLRVPGIRIAEPECVSKSFPHFWDELERFRVAQGGK